MRGIREERLKAILHNQILTPKTQSFVQYLIDDECQELQEPWMTLEEFLKSGFRGKCWIAFKDKTVVDSIFVEGQFFESEVDSDGYRGSFRLKNITHIRPIHTPEPPI